MDYQDSSNFMYRHRTLAVVTGTVCVIGMAALLVGAIVSSVGVPLG